MWKRSQIPLKQPIKISITKEKNQGCLNFGACYIKNIQNKESPEWLKEKIISLGLKPISAVVDITNYVMFDLNRPLHAYDADKIDSEIIVRDSNEGEEFEGLDNKKYKLKKEFFISGGIGLHSIESLIELFKMDLPIYGVDVNSKFEDEKYLKKIDELKTFIETIKNEIYSR